MVKRFLLANLKIFKKKSENKKQTVQDPLKPQQQNAQDSKKANTEDKKQTNILSEIGC